MVTDREQFQRRLHQVKRAGEAYGAKLYAPREQLRGWIADSQLACAAAAGAVLFLRRDRDRDFQHLFHVADDPTALAALTTDGSAPTADLVGTPANAAAQLAFLEGQLDRYIEQVPSLDVLRRAAAEGKLLLVRHEGAEGGMLMFEPKGRSAQLRFWHVAEEARGQGIGRRLIEHCFALCRDTARIMIRAISDNAAAIGIYRHDGFEMKQLLDQSITKPLPQGYP